MAKYDFLYGNISADIVIGKRFQPYHKNCHNFTIAKSLIEAAKTDRQKAFSYGYLCHLVSDIVAHNFFVPYMIISTYKTRTLTHLYWETRLDNKVERDIWKIVDDFKYLDFSENHFLLKKMLTYNFFPFEIHNGIYKGYILFSKLDKWHKTLDFLRNFSSYRILKFVIRETFSLSVDFCIRVLKKKDDDFLYLCDPMGKKTIEAANMIKRNLKKAYIKKPIDFETEKVMSNHFRSKLKEALYHPDKLLEILSSE